MHGKKIGVFFFLEICLILLILVLDRHDSGAVQARREPSHVDRVEDCTRLSSQGNKSINTCKANEGRCSGSFPLPPTLNIYSLPASLTRLRITKVTFFDLVKGYVWKDRQCPAQALPGSENSQHHFQVKPVSTRFYYWKYNFPMTPHVCLSVGWLVGRSVCLS